MTCHARAFAVCVAALVVTLPGCRERLARADGNAAGTPSALPAASSAAKPSELEAGGLVVVRAKKPLGVPLHPAPDSSSVSGRLPDGARARILSTTWDGRWFEIETEGGRGFVARRYLEVPGASRRAALRDDSPWASSKACLSALRGARAPRDPKLARIGAWNLRWFPDGRAGNAKPDGGTDLEWLACSIAWLGVDVLAVQEIKHGPRAERALAELRQRLDGLTGGRWASVLDDCPRGASQHVGLLYDARRAQLTNSRTVGELNPHGEPCKDQLRPGLAGTFVFSGGLDLTVVAAHLKSGPDARALALRERSFASFGSARDALRKLTGDGDVLVLGDMNTMGCESCSPGVGARDELGRADTLLGAGFRRVAADQTCSHYYSGKATLLDWAAANDLAELSESRRATVSGPCGELACANPRGELDATRRLSDHCPFFVDIDDRDRD